MRMYALLVSILNMSLTGGIAIVFVMLARILLRKAPKIFSYALWAVVLFRLVCPVSFSSAFSVMGLLRMPAEENGGIPFISTDIVHTSDIVRNEYLRADMPSPDSDEVKIGSLLQDAQLLPADPPEAPVAVATMLWIIGMAVMLAYSVVSLLMLRQRLIGSVCLRDNIFLADHIPTPFVMGVLKPRIYIPSSLPENEQGYVILHEKIHIRRFDHIVKILAFIVLAIHWFNPLVWTAFVLCMKDMEMSCDERVLKEMGEGIRFDYSNSMLSLAAGRRLISGSPLAFGEWNVKERIRNVLNFKKPAVWIIAVSLVFVAALGFALAANRAGDKAEGDLHEISGNQEDISGIPDEKEIRLASKQEQMMMSRNNMEIVVPISPELSAGLQIGADMTELDYASDEIVIFHDYFGLFVYDIELKKIVRSLDLESIGCHFTQGDNYCEVAVSEDGKTVQLHPMSSDRMYVYSVPDKLLVKKPYKSMDGRFDDFVDITNIVDYSEAGKCSHTAVSFDNGDYGYLYTSDWTLDTLYYVRGDSTYKLFDFEETSD